MFPPIRMSSEFCTFIKWYSGKFGDTAVINAVQKMFGSRIATPILRAKASPLFGDINLR